MPFAVITFDFDPLIPVAGIAVRWETVGTAGAILVALLAAAILARRAPPDGEGRRLHLDDLLLIAIAAVPGAILGGRLGYAVIHLDYFASRLSALLDPGQGGFELALGVAGGVATAAYLARVIDAPVGRWAHVAAVPMLLAIEGGKAAMAWGGSGQGLLSAAEWATRYVGAGPWGSLGPELPAHPSQLYEAAAALGIAALLTAAMTAGAFGGRDGRLLLVALAAWLVGRAAVATTWRDPAILGPLSADQILSLALAGGCIGGLVFLSARRPRPVPSGPIAGWPDPAVSETWRTSPER